MKPPDRGVGPPGDRDGGSRSSPRPATVEELAPSSSTPHPYDNRAPRQCSPDPWPWRRRRAASWRLPPLADGAADPWRPWRPERVSPVQVQGAVDAARHLLAEGLPPIFDADTVTAIWRRGGDDRALAEELHALTGRVVA